MTQDIKVSFMLRCSGRTKAVRSDRKIAVCGCKIKQYEYQDIKTGPFAVSYHH